MLPCPHVGEPPGTPTWTRDEHALSAHHRFEYQPDGGLLIRECRSADAGNYTCRVSNAHGTDSVTYALVVLGKQK